MHPVCPQNTQAGPEAPQGTCSLPSSPLQPHPGRGPPSPSWAWRASTPCPMSSTQPPGCRRPRLGVRTPGLSRPVRLDPGPRPWGLPCPLSERGWTLASLLTSSWPAARHPSLCRPRLRRAGRALEDADKMRQSRPRQPGPPGKGWRDGAGPPGDPCSWLPAQDRPSCLAAPVGELCVPGWMQDDSRLGPPGRLWEKENHVLFRPAGTVVEVALPGCFLGR